MHLELKLEPESFLQIEKDPARYEKGGVELAHFLADGIRFRLLHSKEGEFLRELNETLESISRSETIGIRKCRKLLGRLTDSEHLLGIRKQDEGLLPANCAITSSNQVGPEEGVCNLDNWKISEGVASPLKEADFRRLHSEPEYLERILQSVVNYASGITIFDPYIGHWLVDFEVESWTERKERDLSEPQKRRNDLNKRLVSAAVLKLAMLSLNSRRVLTQPIPLTIEIVTEAPRNFHGDNYLRFLKLGGDGFLEAVAEQITDKIENLEFFGTSEIRLVIEFKEKSKIFSERYLKSDSAVFELKHGSDDLGRAVLGEYEMERGKPVHRFQISQDSRNARLSAYDYSQLSTKCASEIVISSHKAAYER